MTVKDLQDHLSSLDPSLEVFVWGHTQGSFFVVPAHRPRLRNVHDRYVRYVKAWITEMSTAERDRAGAKIKNIRKGVILE